MAAKFALILCVLGFISAQTVFGLSSIYDDFNDYSLASRKGNPIALNHFPYYSNYYLNYPSNIYHPSICQRISQIANKYNVRESDLFQYYYLTKSYFPSLPPTTYLRILEALAAAIRKEINCDILNPTDPSVNFQYLTYDDLMKYLPYNFPPSYAIMLNNLYSLIPPLSETAKREIESAIYSNIPSSINGRAQQLVYELQISILFSLSNQYQFFSNY